MRSSADGARRSSMLAAAERSVEQDATPVAGPPRASPGSSAAAADASPAAGWVSSQQHQQQQQQQQQHTAATTFRRYAGRDAATSRATLAFLDPALESHYREYSVAKTVSKVRWVCGAFAAAVCALGALEQAAWVDPSGDGPLLSRAALGGVRAATVAVSLAFAALGARAAARRSGHGAAVRHGAVEALMFGVFAAQATLLVAADVAVLAPRGRAPDDVALLQYGPVRWWSIGFVMIHLALLLLAGLRFPLLVTVALAEPALCAAVGLALLPPGAHAVDLDLLLVLCASIVGCLLVSRRRESIERREFVSLLNVSADKRMREELLNQMLPSRIKELLQGGGGGGVGGGGVGGGGVGGGGVDGGRSGAVDETDGGDGDGNGPSRVPKSGAAPPLPPQRRGDSGRLALRDGSTVEVDGGGGTPGRSSGGALTTTLATRRATSRDGRRSAFGVLRRGGSPTPTGGDSARTAAPPAAGDSDGASARRRGDGDIAAGAAPRPPPPPLSSRRLFGSVRRYLGGGADGGGTESTAAAATSVTTTTTAALAAARRVPEGGATATRRFRHSVASIDGAADVTSASGVAPPWRATHPAGSGGGGGGAHDDDDTAASGALFASALALGRKSSMRVGAPSTSVASDGDGSDGIGGGGAHRRDAVPIRFERRITMGRRGSMTAAIAVARPGDGAVDGGVGAMDGDPVAVRVRAAPAAGGGAGGAPGAPGTPVGGAAGSNAAGAAAPSISALARRASAAHIVGHDWSTPARAAPSAAVPAAAAAIASQRRASVRRSSVSDALAPGPGPSAYIVGLDRSSSQQHAASVPGDRRRAAPSDLVASIADSEPIGSVAEALPPGFVTPSRGSSWRRNIGGAGAQTPQHRTSPSPGGGRGDGGGGTSPSSRNSGASSGAPWTLRSRLASAGATVFGAGLGRPEIRPESRPDTSAAAGAQPTVVAVAIAVASPPAVAVTAADCDGASAGSSTAEVVDDELRPRASPRAPQRAARAYGATPSAVTALAGIVVPASRRASMSAGDALATNFSTIYEGEEDGVTGRSVTGQRPTARGRSAAGGRPPPPASAGTSRRPPAFDVNGGLAAAVQLRDAPHTARGATTARGSRYFAGVAGGGGGSGASSVAVGTVTVVDDADSAPPSARSTRDAGRGAPSRETPPSTARARRSRSSWIGDVVESTKRRLTAVLTAPPASAPGDSAAAPSASASRYFSARRGADDDGDDERGDAAADGGDGASDGGALRRGDSAGSADGELLSEAVAHTFPEVTVMFIYINNLNHLSGRADPVDLVEFLNRLYTRFDVLMDETGVYKVMAIANMYLCVSGALDGNVEHAETMADTALRVMKLMARGDDEFRLAGEAVEVQIGLHTGAVAAGVIGTRTFNWHIFGDTVNTASRMCSNAMPGRIQLSPATAEALRAVNTDGFRFLLTQRGPTFFKGKGLIDSVWLTDMELEALTAVVEQRRQRRASAAAAAERAAAAGPHAPVSAWGADDSSGGAAPPVGLLSLFGRRPDAGDGKPEVGLRQLASARRAARTLAQRVRKRLASGASPGTDAGDESHRSGDGGAAAADAAGAAPSARAAPGASLFSALTGRRPSTLGRATERRGSVNGARPPSTGRGGDAEADADSSRGSGGGGSGGGGGGGRARPKHESEGTTGVSVRRLRVGASTRMLGGGALSGGPPLSPPRVAEQVAALRELVHRDASGAETPKPWIAAPSAAAATSPSLTAPATGGGSRGAAASSSAFGRSVRGGGVLAMSRRWLLSMGAVKRDVTEADSAATPHATTPHTPHGGPAPLKGVASFGPSSAGGLLDDGAAPPADADAAAARSPAAPTTTAAAGRSHRRASRPGAPAGLASVAEGASTSLSLSPAAGSGARPLAPPLLVGGAPAPGDAVVTSRRRSGVTSTRAVGLVGSVAAAAAAGGAPPPHALVVVRVDRSSRRPLLPSAPAGSAALAPSSAVPAVAVVIGADGHSTHRASAGTTKVARILQSFDSGRDVVGGDDYAIVEAALADTQWRTAARAPGDMAIAPGAGGTVAAGAAGAFGSQGSGGARSEPPPAGGAAAHFGSNAHAAATASATGAGDDGATTRRSTSGAEGAAAAGDGAIVPWAAPSNASADVGDDGTLTLAPPRRAWCAARRCAPCGGCRARGPFAACAARLSLRFRDAALEHRYATKIRVEARRMLFAAFGLALLIAVAAFVRTVSGHTPSADLGGGLTALMLDRLVLVGGTAACWLMFVATGRGVGRRGGGSGSGSGGGGATPPLAALPAHEAASALLCLVFTTVCNATLLPSFDSLADPSRLANLNFALFIAFSFLEMRAALLVATNVVCVAIYLGFLASSATMQGDPWVVAHAVVAAAGGALSAIAGYIRESSRRSKFLVAQHAQRQKLKCERLLINMLPSQDHVDRLMAGEQVVEVLEDVTMLYSDVKGFTEMSAKMSPEDLIRFLDALFSAFDQHLEPFNLYKIETIGDAFIVLGGMDSARPVVRDRVDAGGAVTAAAPLAPVAALAPRGGGGDDAMGGSVDGGSGLGVGVAGRGGSGTYGLGGGGGGAGGARAAAHDPWAAAVAAGAPASRSPAAGGGGSVIYGLAQTFKGAATAIARAGLGGDDGAGSPRGAGGGGSPSAAADASPRGAPAPATSAGVRPRNHLNRLRSKRMSFTELAGGDAAAAAAAVAAAPEAGDAAGAAAVARRRFSVARQPAPPPAPQPMASSGGKGYGSGNGDGGGSDAVVDVAPGACAHGISSSSTGPTPAPDSLAADDPLAGIDWANPPVTDGRMPLSHCGAVALFAMDMLREIARIRAETGVPVELRIGIHTGRVVGGVIGKSRPRYFIWGQDTVLANRMESTGVAGQIQVSESAAARLHAEGFVLEPFQDIPRDYGADTATAHGTCAAPPKPGESVRTFLLRSYVTTDGTTELTVLPPTAKPSS